MTHFHHGFKTAAANLAQAVRGEIGLSPRDPLDPFRLADHLALPVLPMSALGDLAEDAVQYFSGSGSGEFSAMIVFNGIRRTIVYNDCHAPTRQKSDLSHEIAHALLLHEPVRDLRGRARHDPQQEAEAHWLGGVLLVPDRACLAICRDGIGLADAAHAMGVSQALMRWRINVSGASIRVKRERGAHQRVESGV